MKQGGKPMDDHYCAFNRLAEELRQIFPITSNVQQMQNPVYFLDMPYIMGSSDVSSLPPYR